MKLLSTTECARLLNIKEHQIAYAYRCGKLDEPELRVSGRRTHTIDDLRRMAEYFGVPLKEDEEATA